MAVIQTKTVVDAGLAGAAFGRNSRNNRSRILRWKFAGGTKPTYSTAASAVDVISYYGVDSMHIQAALFGLAFQ